MNIKLRPEFREKLITELKNILDDAQFSSNSYLDSTPFYRLNALETDLRKKPVWKLLESYVSDQPLKDFFFEVIATELKKREFKLGVGNSPLNSIQEYHDTQMVAEELVSNFELLPREYKVFIESPFMLAWEFDRFKKDASYRICENFELASYDDTHKETFPEVSIPNPKVTFTPFGRVGQKELALNWLPERTYFEFTFAGYVGTWVETTPLRNSLFFAKAFYGLALSLGLIESGNSPISSNAHMVVYSKVDSTWIPEVPRRLSYEVGQAIDSFKIKKSGHHNMFVSEENHWLERLKIIGNVFTNASQNDTIIRSAQWLFDSYAGEDELLSFVKATVCLEILLGDKKTSDIISLGTLLSNRCAYLISSSSREREDIIKDFKDIYDTRSGIVHNGKNHLSTEERANLFKLRNLCKRVISKEIFLQTPS